MTEKKLLRKETIDKVRSIDINTRKEWNKRIIDKLTDTDQYKNANNIMVYMPMDNEIDTTILIEQAWADRKDIYLPYTFPKTREMKPTKLTSYDQLEKGDFDILTPRSEHLDFVEKGELDLIIVPGVIFNSKGYRIGYGGGYYDRFLKDLDVDTISLLYSIQLNENIPIYNHDIPVEMLITEQ